MTTGQRRAVGDREAEARKRLIDATQELLGNAGAESLTSRSITEVAEVNLGAITYYFGSKQKLVDEAMLALAHSLLEPVLRELDSTSDPVAKMLRTIQALNELLTDNRHAAGAYLQTVASAATGAEFRQPLAKLMRIVEDVLQREIRSQQVTGSLPDWIDPDAMAQLTMAVVHGTLVASSLEPDRIDHTRIGAQFGRLLLTARTDTPEASE